MDGRHSDPAMCVFHGEGMVPATETVLTPGDFAAGIEPELTEAIGVLSP